MSLAKAKRKIKRIGKTAVQFRVSSTFEFIELECKGTWRPDKLRVVWLRNHRKVKSNDTTMVVSEDFGPNGAKGKAIFNPAIAVSLLVTLYRDSNETEFEEKEYKYQIESEGPSGKKILATFNCNIAEFVGIPSTKQALDLNFKCVSKKVKSVKLGITMECTFMKEGKALDDDMQSTFSAISAGVESVTLDEDDDDDDEPMAELPSPREAVEITSMGSASGGNRDRLNTLREEPESDIDRSQSVVLGTGEHLKRDTIPNNAPPKPARTPSLVRKEESPGAVETPPTQTGQYLSPPSVGSAANGSSSEVVVAENGLKSASADVMKSGSYDKLLVVSDKSPGSPNIIAKSGTYDTLLPASDKEPEAPNRNEDQGLEVASSSASKTSPATTSNLSGNSGTSSTDNSQSATSSTLTKPEGSDVQLAQESERRGSNQDSVIKSNKEKESKVEAKPASKEKQSGGDMQEKGSQEENVMTSKSDISKDEPANQAVKTKTPAESKADSVTEEERKPINKVAVETVETNIVSHKVQANLADESRHKAMEHDRTQMPDQEKKATVSQDTQTTSWPRKPQMVDQASQTIKEEEKVVPKVVTVDQGVQTDPEMSAAIKVVDKEESKPEPSNEPMIKETVMDARMANSPPASPSVATKTATSNSATSNSATSNTDTAAAAGGTSTISSSPPRKSAESKETVVPSSPLAEEEEDSMEEVPKKKSPTSKWIDSSVVFIDCFGEAVGREKLDQADIIGLYFSAGWCPPCRRFLPKLVKFYHHLKQQGKSFELVYVSSDYSRQDMMKYMKEQQMPWVGVEYEGEASDNFRKTYKVSAVPLLKILGTRGDVIEESAKKAIEGASNGSAILKLYNKWHEKLEEARTNKQGSRKGLLSKIKKSKEESEESESSPQPSDSSERMTLTSRQRSKEAKVNKISQELLDEKEEKIQHLEEVNKTLKQANDEMREEIEALKAQLGGMTTEVEQLRANSSKLEDESKQMVNNLNMRGWLFKRGLKGPTAKVWRRRFFRLDEGSKLYYYKNSTEGVPQGYIDLDKVLGVQEVSDAQQDKNHATFTVQCDGRTFQLQAHDEASMRRWIEAIMYITEWRKRNSTLVEDRGGAHP